MADKTKKMIVVEQQFKERLETLLPKMVTARGLSATADQLGIDKSTLAYWLLKLNIKVTRVALAPGDTLTLERHGKPKEDVQ